MRVVRFYVSLVLLLLLLLLLLRVLLSFSSPTAMMCAQCSVPDLHCDRVRPVLRVGPQPRMCEASVALRTSTTIMCGQCCVPDLNRDHVSSVWRVGPQPEDMSERMSEDMSERMSERMSKDMPERNSGSCQQDVRKNVIICERYV